MQQETKKKNLFSFSNIITAILVVFAAGMLLFPNFKATILQGLMKVGLFQPGVSAQTEQTVTDKNWDVVFTNSRGEIIDGNALKGKIVFLNFWATWCPPCIAEMPSVNKFYKDYKSNPDIVFLIVDADNNFAKSEKFMADKGFELPVQIAQTNIPREWYEGSLPTTVLLDKKGNIVYHHAGVANYNSTKFKNFIDGLLNE